MFDKENNNLYFDITWKRPVILGELGRGDLDNHALRMVIRSGNI